MCCGLFPNAQCRRDSALSKRGRSDLIAIGANRAAAVELGEPLPAPTAAPLRSRLDRNRGSATRLAITRDGNAERLALPPLRHRHIIAPCCTRVDLPRAADALLWVFHHLLPLADPADRAGHREQGSEHAGGEAHRLQDDA